jgi:hypothetical protein
MSPSLEVMENICRTIDRGVGSVQENVRHSSTVRFLITSLEKRVEQFYNITVSNFTEHIGRSIIQSADMHVTDQVSWPGACVGGGGHVTC